MHLYLHIPFCKQACHYCDFHFSTNLSKKKELVNGLVREIELQKDYLNNKHLNTIYFGGGTPSLLDKEELSSVFEAINRFYTVDSKAEVTLEANPDDVNDKSLQLWKSLGINRLSLGIQSFDEAQLKYLNRAHTAEHAEVCIQKSLDAGFKDFSIDLIYGIPHPTHDIWKKNLEKALSYSFTHLSAYCLTIEDKTVFGHQLKKKQMKPIDEDFAAEQFEILLRETEKHQIEQYEISNFARNHQYARHNTSYWKGEPYLGIGPSAHSFDGINRQWNVSNNGLYMKTLAEGKVPFEVEQLSEKDLANELIMTGLRTKWGADLSKITSLVDEDFNRTLSFYLDHQMLQKVGETIFLTPQGKLQADRIASDLFFT
ncbi:radical SAM family heme chaperone HemW [Jiulongibacter sediminis]|uniref:radical SAM family heme chaperone HemW n=1 Tax=Jiulongibacter sediminis TaxID=1605367 RepID=UPI0026EA82B6|nr:radical SAM family heme chaperone HemW [Jiulongibacter sediminis]